MMLHSTLELNIKYVNMCAASSGGIATMAFRCFKHHPIRKFARQASHLYSNCYKVLRGVASRPIGETSCSTNPQPSPPASPKV